VKQSNWRESPAKRQHGVRYIVSAAAHNLQADKHDTGNAGSG